MRLRRQQKIILLTSFILFLSGCSIATDFQSENKKIMSKNQRIYSKYGLVSIMAPINRNIGVYYTVGEYLDEDFLYLDWGIQNMMVCKLVITTESYYAFDSVKYLNAENLKFFEEETKTKESFYNPDNGAPYKKAFVDYIDGVKCRTFIRRNLSQVYPHTINGEKTYTQHYDTYCSFYQATNSNKVTNMIRMQYEYSFNKNSKAFTDTNKTKQEVLNDIENTFRQDIQAIFSTIKLGMDREKMKKEGLLFDKPYKVQF